MGDGKKPGGKPDSGAANRQADRLNRCAISGRIPACRSTRRLLGCATAAARPWPRLPTPETHAGPACRCAHTTAATAWPRPRPSAQSRPYAAGSTRLPRSSYSTTRSCCVTPWSSMAVNSRPSTTAYVHSGNICNIFQACINTKNGLDLTNSQSVTSYNCCNKY